MYGNPSSIPNEQKKLETTYRENKQQEQKNPTISFTYIEPKPVRQQPQKFLEPYGAIQQIPPYYYNMQNGIETRLPQFPITKVYQFTNNDPKDDTVMNNIIYEDAFPTNELSGDITLTTINERMMILKFIRTIMFMNKDGNDISISKHGGSKSKKLSSYIKFDRLNPYNGIEQQKNPYKGLPPNFLLYNSCYPIRTNKNSIVCARNSTSVNIRIYGLTDGSFNISKNPTDASQYDEWRDIIFYETIRNKIIKLKSCPNFITLYGYFISEDANIDFNKINQLNGTVQTSQPAFSSVKTPPTMTKEDIIKELKKSQQKQPTNPSSQVMQLTGVNPQPQPQPQPQQILTTNVSNINRYTGKCLIAITEAPTYHVIDWATVKYSTNGNVRRMINRGIHSNSEWENIFFQIFAALYTLEKNNIAIKNFSLEKNVFIKDIPVYGQAKKYWKYIIDGIEYYVPNYGFLVLIDSHFRDVSFQPVPLLPNNAQPHTIDKTILNKELDSTIPDTDMKKSTIEMFHNAFNPSNYGQPFVNKNGAPPEPEIFDIMTDIIAHQDYFKEYFNNPKNFMFKFLNNRIGTQLTSTEMMNIKESNDFKKGQIIVNKNQKMYMNL